jgi:hypothetical protein
VTELRFQAGDVVVDPAGSVSLLGEGHGAVGTLMAGSMLRLAYRASPKALAAFEESGLVPVTDSVLYFSDCLPVLDKGNVTPEGMVRLFYARALHPRSALEWLGEREPALKALLASGDPRSFIIHDEIAEWPRGRLGGGT